MKKSKLMQLVGKRVKVIFKDGDEIQGVLGYTKVFSIAHNWRKTKRFTIGTLYDFRASHVKKAEVLDDSN